MTVRRRVAVIALLVVTVLAGGACGSDSGISDAAGTQLQLRVIAIRDAAAQGDRDTAQTRVDELRAAVVQLRNTDDLDDAAVTRILNALDDVEENLSLLSREPSETTTTTSETTTTETPTTSESTTTLETTTTSTTTTTTTAPPPDPPGKGKGKGGKGK